MTYDRVGPGRFSTSSSSSCNKYMVLIVPPPAQAGEETEAWLAARGAFRPAALRRTDLASFKAARAPRPPQEEIYNLIAAQSQGKRSASPPHGKTALVEGAAGRASIKPSGQLRPTQFSPFIKSMESRHELQPSSPLTTASPGCSSAAGGHGARATTSSSSASPNPRSRVRKARKRLIPAPQACSAPKEFGEYPLAHLPPEERKVYARAIAIGSRAMGRSPASLGVATPQRRTCPPAVGACGARGGARGDAGGSDAARPGGGRRRQPS